MSELKDHPQITELMEALDKNDMHREKKEVEALVDYIGDMRKRSPKCSRKCKA